MANKNLVGRCGLYCGYCSIYRAYKDGGKFREEVAKRNNCRLEDVKCEGCQTIGDDSWSQEEKWGKNCKILRCLNAKKNRFCYECNEYATCQKYDEFAKLCLLINVDVRKNMQTIEEGKTEEWLMKQEKKWRCSKCGNPVANSVEVDDCHWCGHKLRK